MESEIVADRMALQRLVNGFQVSQALHALVHLGVADALGVHVDTLPLKPDRVRQWIRQRKEAP